MLRLEKVLEVGSQPNALSKILLHCSQPNALGKKILLVRSKKSSTLDWRPAQTENPVFVLFFYAKNIFCFQFPKFLNKEKNIQYTSENISHDFNWHV